MRYLKYREVSIVLIAPLAMVILGYTHLSANIYHRRESTVPLWLNDKHIFAGARSTATTTSTNSSTEPRPVNLDFGSKAKKIVASGPGASAAFTPSKTAAKETTSKDQESQGHIFVYSSFEEQTNGARNLWQLEIWAKQVNMTVAEPFAVNSMFGAMGAIPSFNSTLRFGDYFDKEKWNEMVNKYNGSQLIEWEEFIPNAPRQAIILYTLLRTVKPGLIVSYGEDDVKKYNPGKNEQITNSDMFWIKRNFNITRVVTFVHNELTKNPLTLEEYRSYIFGDLKPNQVTLICVNWIGIGVKTWRTQIVSAPVSFLNAINVEFQFPVDGSYVSPMVAPSQKIIKAYKNYVSEYVGDRKYIAAVFRTFTVMYYHYPNNFAGRSKYLLNCSKKLKNELNKVRNKWEIFLAYDLGTFGSGEYSYFNKSHEKQVTQLRNQILSDVYGGSPQKKQRDERLIKAAGGITDRGFIAILEKTIATHADCIVLLGVASSFVRSSANMYISLHENNVCVVSICSEKFLNAKGKVVSSGSIPGKFLH